MTSSHRSHRRAWGAAGLGALVLALTAAMSLAAFALANSLTLGVAGVRLSGPSGTRTEPIAVTSRGLAVYELGGESTRHLLCTSAACLHVWPPVTVARGAKPRAAGVSGRLSTVRRHGFNQVTLNGHPLYTFVGDGGRRGIATGDGLNEFGGIWHVFKER